MNYEKLYFAFIEKYKNQVFDKGVYTEVHHIIPRHAGGDDSKENLIRLTYKQHIFAHHILWKAYKNGSDYSAWLMMTKQEVDAVVAGRKARGKANVESGLLDRIRPLANNEKQRQWAKDLAQERIESGVIYKYIAMASDVWRGSHHTEEFKAKRSADYKVFYAIPENLESLRQRQVMAVEKKQENASLHSEDVIVNAERNEEFLHMTSSRSKNKFVSPEGLEFDSPIYAANYYGNGVEYYIIENWCKRSQHGWYRKPKAAKE